MTSSIPREIVVGVDFSKAGRAALKLARRVAALGEGHLWLVTVFDPSPFGPAVDFGSYAEGWAGLRDDVEADITHELNRLREERREGVPTDVQVVRASDAASALADFASIVHADLVVVGSHGRTGWERLLLGSVAEKTLRLAPCPVLIAR